MSDRWAVAVAIATGAGALCGAAAPQLLPLALAVTALAFALRWPALACLGAALLASGLSGRAAAGLDPPSPISFAGQVTLLSDPAPVMGAVRAEVRIGGRRYEAWARGPAAWQLERRLAGERVVLEGTVRPPADEVRERLHRRHVVGRLSVSAVGEWDPGPLPARIANGLRRTLSAGVESLPADRRTLFTGLVFGDDRGQAVEVADDFRAAGLTHLLAVSGQNVAFVLAVCAPLLRRLGLRTRFAAVLAVIGLFGLVTRWEPSVMRAAAMAAVATTAVTLGRDASGVRRLALAVSAVILVDPFLVWSVGFQLSVGASAGILFLAAPLERALPGPRWLAAGAAVTAAAQVGVAPVLIPTFGGLPLATFPANLLAAPVAGPVMMWGLTGGLAAGVTGGPLAPLLHLPTRLLLWWLAAVARWSASLPLGELGGGHAVALGLAAAVGVVLWRRGRSPRVAIVAALAVVLSPALAPPSRVADGHELLSGARLWRSGPAAVLVVDGAVSAPRLLEALRTVRVRRLDVVALERGSAAAADALRPVLSRVHARLILAPAGHQLRGAVTPVAGARIGVGALEVEIVDVSPHLRIRVGARAPPV